MRLIERVHIQPVPDRNGRRLEQVTFTIDIDAVRDYIMYEGTGSGRPWPVVVVGELSDTLIEIAQQVEMLSLIRDGVPVTRVRK